MNLGKKQKLNRKMKHIKNKSEAIFDTEGLEERQKMKQVQALVKKNLSKRENKKSYVIGKKAAPTKYGKNSRYLYLNQNP